MIRTPSCEAALIYAARGWYSFPAIWGAKTPATTRGFRDATSDAMLLEHWFNGQRYNIGIATEASGLVVIDIDGATAQEVFDGFLAEACTCDGIPTTYTVKTRSLHGRHYYFRAPHHFQVKSSVGLLGPGIDVRAAGGYVVAPPSWVDADHKGPEGAYEVIIDAPVIDLPYSLGMRLHSLQHPSLQQTHNTPTTKSCRPETPRNIALLKEQLRHISADCSYEVYRRIIWGTLSSGWSCAEQLALDWSQTAPDRFDQLTFEALVRYFDPNRADCPSLGSIYHAARAGGWNG
jgi:hypothetical protein